MKARDARLLVLKDRAGSIDVYRFPNGKIVAMRWPRAGLVRVWTLVKGSGPSEPENVRPPNSIERANNSQGES